MDDPTPETRVAEDWFADQEEPLDLAGAFISVTLNR